MSIHGPLSSLPRSPSSKPFKPGPGTPFPQKTSIVNVEIEVIQLFKSTAYSILVSHVVIFRTCIFAHWPLVTGIVECSRIYHVLSNLLGMLRNSFVALSSKQYSLDFFLKTRMCPWRIYPPTSGKGLIHSGSTTVSCSVGIMTSC